MLIELYRLCSTAAILATMLCQRSAATRRYRPEIGIRAFCLQHSARLKVLGGPAEHTDKPRFD